MGNLSNETPWRVESVLGVAVMAFVLGGFLIDTRARYLELGRKLGSTLLPPEFPVADEVRRYAALQQSIPPGSALITRVKHPYLLDFGRNRVFVVDWPGGASPPPGMPTFGGGNALADYFIARRIRYVAYSYATHDGMLCSEVPGERCPR